MVTKKYEILFSEETIISGKKVYPIKALKTIKPADGSVIKPGTRGGYISDKNNLEQFGECWIENGSIVVDSAIVYGDAFVGNNSKVESNVFVGDNSIVLNSVISKCVKITDDSTVCDSKITDKVRVYGKSTVSSSELTQEVIIKNSIIRKSNIKEFVNVIGSTVHQSDLSSTSSFTDCFVQNSCIDCAIGFTASKILCDIDKDCFGYKLSEYPFWNYSTHYQFARIKNAYIEKQSDICIYPVFEKDFMKNVFLHSCFVYHRTIELFTTKSNIYSCLCYWGIESGKIGSNNNYILPGTMFSVVINSLFQESILKKFDYDMYQKFNIIKEILRYLQINPLKLAENILNDNCIDNIDYTYKKIGFLINCAIVEAVICTIKETDNDMIESWLFFIDSIIDNTSIDLKNFKIKSLDNLYLIFPEIIEQIIKKEGKKLIDLPKNTILIPKKIKEV